MCTQRAAPCSGQARDHKLVWPDSEDLFEESVEGGRDSGETKMPRRDPTRRARSNPAGAPVRFTFWITPSLSRVK